MPAANFVARSSSSCLHFSTVVCACGRRSGASRVQVGLRLSTSWSAPSSSRLDLGGLVSPYRRSVGAMAEVSRSMSPELVDFIASLHASPVKTAIVTTGGAAQLASWLLSVPGASNTVLESTMAYAPTSLTDYLGAAPPNACSEHTARLMARAAYQRAAQLLPLDDPSPIVGLASTCALATGRPKKGDHRAWAALHDGRRTVVYGMVFEKGARSRDEEDAVATVAALSVLARACGVPLPPGLESLIKENEVVVDTEEDAGDPLEALVAGTVRCVEFSRHGGVTRAVVDAPRPDLVMLPGSFNPIHEGHTGLLEAGLGKCVEDGEAVLGAVMELTIENADKGLLPLDDVRKRVDAVLDAGHSCMVTRAPLFTNKAELFRGARFVVGHDTAIRLVMPKYYSSSEVEMVRQFSRLRARGCRFLVAGRVQQDKTGGKGGAFQTLDDMEVPECLRPLDMFTAIPEREFRRDISSTELRRLAESGVPSG